MYKSAIHFLNLVYPPFSNQEGEWLSKDPDVKVLLSSSKLYMIGQRKEIFFDSYSCDEGQIRFDLICGDNRIQDVMMHVSQFKIKHEIISLEMGPKIIRILAKNDDEEDLTLIEWFTPDKLLFDYWRDTIEVSNLEQFETFTDFNLYYVGVSTKSDSLSRLFETAHEKRSRILGNEIQLNPMARLTDELVMLLFVVEDVQVHSYSINDNLDDVNLFRGFDVSCEKMSIDAEAAFIKILQSKYNTIKYSNYPTLKGGLNSVGYNQYGFLVNENITLRTESNLIKGKRVEFGKNPDFIWVDDSKVSLYKSTNY